MTFQTKIGGTVTHFEMYFIMLPIAALTIVIYLRLSKCFTSFHVKTTYKLKQLYLGNVQSTRSTSVSPTLLEHDKQTSQESYLN